MKFRVKAAMVTPIASAPVGLLVVMELPLMAVIVVPGGKIG